MISGEHEEWFRRANQRAWDIGLIRSPYKLGTAADVELKFAIRMRHQGLTKEAIVINREPCTGIYGCHELLPDFLPEGAELTVYGPDGLKRVYRGRSDDE